VADRSLTAPSRAGVPLWERPDPIPSSAPVTVVIPTLDEERYLPLLLTDLARQRVRAREVIVVDAGSRDRTSFAARSAGAFFLTGGGLPGLSRNHGASWAECEWLLFLDADVRMAPDAIAVALAAMERRRLDAASCGFVPDRGGFLMRVQHRFSFEYFWLTSKLGWPHSIGAFLLVRRSLHEAIGGFDLSVRVAEDQDYVRRLARAGRYGFLRRPVVEIAVRRFDAEGFWKQSLKWLGIELHRMVLGEIRGDYFRYFK
jgi:glycosyltransferase involved in cell wall biosynthesis